MIHLDKKRNDPERLEEDRQVFLSGLGAATGHELLTAHSFLTLYQNGWWTTEEEGVICALRPRVREFIPVHFSLPRSARRAITHGNFSFSTNQAFEYILEKCATPRDWSCGNAWMGQTTRGLLVDIFALGAAHSIEIYKNDEIVGGIIGINTGSIFVGLSVFREAENAGTAAFVAMQALLCQRRYNWVDAIIPSEISRTFGGQLITADEHADLLGLAADKRIGFPTLHEQALAPFIAPLFVSREQGQCLRPGQRIAAKPPQGHFL